VVVCRFGRQKMYELEYGRRSLVQSREGRAPKKNDLRLRIQGNLASRKIAPFTVYRPGCNKAKAGKPIPSTGEIRPR
jgi:hypothetical protein